MDRGDMDDIGQKVCEIGTGQGKHKDFEDYEIEVKSKKKDHKYSMFEVFIFTIVLDVLRALMKIYFMYCGSDAGNFICWKTLFGFAFLICEDVAQIALLTKVMFLRKDGGEEIGGQEQFSLTISIFSIIITFLGICMNCCKHCGGKTDETEDELYQIQINEK